MLLPHSVLVDYSVASLITLYIVSLAVRERGVEQNGGMTMLRVVAVRGLWQQSCEHSKNIALWNLCQPCEHMISLVCYTAFLKMSHPPSPSPPFPLTRTRVRRFRVRTAEKGSGKDKGGRSKAGRSESDRVAKSATKNITKDRGNRGLEIRLHLPWGVITLVSL